MLIFHYISVYLRCNSAIIIYKIHYDIMLHVFGTNSAKLHFISLEYQTMFYTTMNDLTVQYSVSNMLQCDKVIVNLPVGTRFNYPFVWPCITCMRFALACFTVQILILIYLTTPRVQLGINTLVYAFCVHLFQSYLTQEFLVLILQKIQYTFGIHICEVILLQPCDVVMLGLFALPIDSCRLLQCCALFFRFCLMFRDLLPDHIVEHLLSEIIDPFTRVNSFR